MTRGGLNLVIKFGKSTRVDLMQDTRREELESIEIMENRMTTPGFGFILLYV